MGPNLLAGALTLAVMSLPVIIVAAREPIRAVPESIRPAPRPRRHQVANGAPPGPTGGHARHPDRHHPGPVAGHRRTAPLLVIGLPIVIFSLPDDLRDYVTALPLLIFDWTSRPQPAFAEAAAAASIVLLALLLAMNAVAIYLRNRFTIGGDPHDARTDPGEGA